MSIANEYIIRKCFYFSYIYYSWQYQANELCQKIFLMGLN
uniref:Uncharacterized protein n=1 Tax=Myoviridae sp. ctFPV8 TaxID=2825068 RepID=A0A8S5PB47_9CAUD|nr:MAG TPA: hypothetical protein [Myoviridae sp. ctFPV8]